MQPAALFPTSPVLPVPDLAALIGVVARADPDLTYEVHRQASSLTVRLSRGRRALSAVLLTPLGPAMRVHLSMLHGAKNLTLDVALNAFADLPVSADFENLHTQAWAFLAAMLAAEPWLNQVAGLPQSRPMALPRQADGESAENPGTP